MSNRNNGNANLNRGKRPAAKPAEERQVIPTPWGDLYEEHIGYAARAVHEGRELAKHGWGVQPHGGYITPPGVLQDARIQASKDRAEEDENDRRRVGNDPQESLEIIAADLTILVKKRIKWLASRGAQEPLDRATMDAMREFRATLEVVNETRLARGAMAFQGEFLATLDARVEDASARMAEGPASPVALPS